MGTRIRGTVLVAVASFILSSCGSAPPNTALTVDDLNVPMHLYTVLVQAGTLRLERAGLPVGPSTASGAARLKGIESSAIKKLVRDAALEKLAKQRQIVVTVGDLDSAVRRIEAGVGGAGVVDRQLALDHLSRQDFRDQLRFTLLEQKLSLADPKGFPAALAAAMKDARVTAYVGPCETNHSYPRCVGGG